MMPPYSARGEGNKDKKHRALLIGVERYTGDYKDLPAVRQNLRLVAEALTAEGTGVLDAADIVVMSGSPAEGAAGSGSDSGSGAVAVNPLETLAAVRAARDEVTGLLIVYFAGHGVVRTDGSDLHLLFSSSRVKKDDRQSPFEDALSWDGDVMSALRNAEADWVVVILDCCYAGNALHSFTPAVRQNFALLTAAEPLVEIPAGDPVEGTEFTRALCRLLTPQPDGAVPVGPVTFTRLVEDIRVAMAPLKAVYGHPWVPDERRHGDDVVLAVAPGSARHDASATTLFIEPRLPSTSGDALPEDPPPEDPVGEPGRRDAALRPPLLSRAGRWWRMRARPAVGALRHRLRPRCDRTTALVLAGVVALAGAGTWLTTSLLFGGTAAACAPPLELRVLTDPDILPTVKKAVDAYPRRDGAGCRTVGINVYDAKATDAVAAFRSSALWQESPTGCPASGDCLRPQRDLGPQPDIWIPAAGSAWQRTAGSAEEASGDRVVTFEVLGPLAFTPMVLAAPDTMPLVPSERTGIPLRSLVTALVSAREDKVSVLRPDPEDTEGALLSTHALYAAQDSGSGSGSASGFVSEFERSMAQALRPMPGTAMDLMCALAEGSRNGLEDRAAVLVPEQTMARFNLSSRTESTGSRGGTESTASPRADGPEATDPEDSGTGRPTCATDTLKPRIARYPSDIPVLDLPFVHVTWKGADRDAEARSAAVTRFHDWLAGDPDAQAVFTEAGFRAADKDGKPVPPADDSPLRADANDVGVLAKLPPTAPEPSPGALAASIDDTLRRYRQALGPGRVLYLLDNSTSMADKQVWDGPGRAKELVVRSMTSLGAGDSYGVWSLAIGKGKKPAQVVEFGPHGRAAAQQAVAATATADHNARIADGIGDALGVLRGGSTGTDQPRLLVLVTDDEDSMAVTKKQLTALLKEAGRAPQVRIVVASLHSGGCTDGGFNERLTTATDGRCLDPAADLPAELNAEVAKTGMGDAR